MVRVRVGDGGDSRPKDGLDAAVLQHFEGFGGERGGQGLGGE